MVFDEDDNPNISNATEKTFASKINDASVNNSPQNFQSDISPEEPSIADKTTKIKYDKKKENNNVQANESKQTGKKITIEVDEDDPCLKKFDEKKTDFDYGSLPGLDPRFQQQDQTVRCFVMYTDFYRCEHILGKGSGACIWFKQVFTSICPIAWIRQWDELREKGRLPWHKYKTQGDFPGDRYGV